MGFLRMALRKERLAGHIFAAGMILTLGVSVSKLNAQSDRGTITGSVSDQTGAVIVGVSVSAINSATGVTAKMSTSSNGNYTIPLLRAGIYQVTAEQSGFKKFVRAGIVVEVGETTRLDVQMELGEVTQTVEVQGDSPLLLSDTSELGTVIGGQQVLDLPLVGQGEQRNPTFFMILVPGVTGRGMVNFDLSQFNIRLLSTTVSGSQSGSTEFHLDGSIIASAGEFSGGSSQCGLPSGCRGGV